MAPANRHDVVLLTSTLDKLAAWRPSEPPTVHLDRGDDSPKAEAELAPVGCGARSPGGADRLRSRSASAGRWNAPTPGSTTSARRLAARSGERR